MSNATETNLLAGLSDVANTALATLFCRALESRSPRPIINDPKAEELMERLVPMMTGNELQRSLARGELEPSMQTYVALRSRQFDRYAAEFLGIHPDGMIVNLGCGFDTRRWRLASKRVIDVDLPEMIAARDQLLGGAAIGCDVLNPAWLSSIPQNVRVMFLAEGLLMYLPEADLRRFIGTLADRFPGGELVAEMFNRYWLQEATSAAIDERLRGQLHFGESARFVSGIEEASELLRWHPGIRLVDEWSFVDENEPKLGRLRKLRHFPLLRKRQWVVRYRFEN